MLTRDGRILFLCRFLRLFGYGFLSVVLVLYLDELGFDGGQFGLILTLTLIGDTLISLWLTTRADRAGRKRMLLAGAALMFFAGVLFASTKNFWILMVAAILGVISPSGKEVGPFLPIEQAALSQTMGDKSRTRIFAWYNLAGSLASAFGALAGGFISQLLHEAGLTLLASYRILVLAYGAVGVALAWCFFSLSSAIEVTDAAKTPGTRPPARIRLGLHRSSGIVWRLAGLFSVDALAGGFIMQSMMAYWFHVRFGVEPALLGSIFFGANILAAVSALAAVRLAERIGLVNTMVFTHLPSNILLILIPFSTSLPVAISLLLLRFSISQMDVPTRQSYTMAVVDPDERSAASGLTGVARTTGAALSPVIAGPLLANPALLNWPFFLAGGIKILYDLVLFGAFRQLKPPEENPELMTPEKSIK